MAICRFDTLDAARSLEAAGMERPLAEAVTRVIRDWDASVVYDECTNEVTNKLAKINSMVTGIDVNLTKADTTLSKLGDAHPDIRDDITEIRKYLTEIGNNLRTLNDSSES